jgi:two-component system sensor histidine kinase PilS (NtrC family)
VAALRLAVVSLALLALVIAILLNPPAEGEVSSWQFFLIGTTYGLSVSYLLLLRFPELIRGLAYTQIALDALLVTALVYMTGGIESPFPFGYVFVVLAASSTLYRSGALIAAATTIGMYGMVLGMHAFGPADVLPSLQGRWGPAILSYMGHSAGMIVVAFLASALAEKLRATGRKLAEKESDLAELHVLHAAILRSLPAGVMSIDDLGNVRFANDAASHILRLPGGELVGRHLSGIVPAMEPAWSQLRDSHFREGNQTRFEADYVRSDGEPVRIGFSVAPLDADSDLNAIIVFQDVTDIIRLKDAVARSERLASVGQFAAGLAHEVRNPLASMCASIDVLEASLSPPDHLRRLMENVTREAERLNGLITDFLALARPRSLEMKSCDVGRLVAEVLDLLEQDRPANVTVIRRVDADVGAELDHDLMKQVVWNLARNGIEALEARGGRLEVEVFRADGTACIRISDDGPGVDESTAAKIFDPFYTTKERGSGLGLAISNSIVEAHGATMIFDSTPGEGTSVSIRFDSSPALVASSSVPTLVERRA